MTMVTFLFSSMERGLNNQQENITLIAPMIGDNEVKDSRGVWLLSEILLYEVYRVDQLLVEEERLIEFMFLTFYLFYLFYIVPN
jgi:hypothetical protein